jgi:hypothetical protein
MPIHKRAPLSSQMIAEQVKSALHFIPKGWGNQNQLRHNFTVQRRYDLGENGDGCSAYVSLLRCLETERHKYLNGIYRFDIEGLKRC